MGTIVFSALATISLLTKAALEAGHFQDREAARHELNISLSLWGDSMEREFVVNRNIKRFIRDTDKKQSAVADRAGIRRDTFSRIVNCRRPVYADEIEGLAEALGVTIAELFAHRE